ncbi:MAG: cytosine permease, partial [Burkholderiaceae bacterium]
MTTSTTTIPPSRPPTATTGNEALTPLGADHRRFGWFDHAALWLSLGVGLLVMQVGAYLVPALGTRDAMLMIVVGSIVGAGVLGWTARIGCDTGLASAGLMHATYGSAFARLPIVLNIVQLIGWTTFELVVMRDGTAAIARQAFGIDVTTTTVIVATLVWGAVLLALISGSMVTLVRRFVARFGLPLVLISLVWLSWQFASRAMTSGWDAFWNRPGAGGMSAMAA